MNRRSAASTWLRWKFGSRSAMTAEDYLQHLQEKAGEFERLTTGTWSCDDSIYGVLERVRESIKELLRLNAGGTVDRPLKIEVHMNPATIRRILEVEVQQELIRFEWQGPLLPINASLVPAPRLTENECICLPKREYIPWFQEAIDRANRRRW